MSPETAEAKPGLRERFMREMRRYLVMAAFLSVFFGAFTTYRRLVLAEYQIGYFEYGWAIFKALILAKVILIGELLHVGERFEDRPLAISTFWKTLSFGLLIVAFAVVERVVAALIHHRPLGEEFQLAGPQGYEMLARIPLEVIALVPLFAFRELARVLGEERLEQLFLHGPGRQTGQES